MRCNILVFLCLLVFTACGNKPVPEGCALKDQDCSAGRVVVRDDSPVSGLKELCQSRCRRLEVLDLQRPTKAQFDELVPAMSGIEEVTVGIGLKAGAEVPNPLAAIATVKRTKSLDGLFDYFYPWSGMYEFNGLESVDDLNLERSSPLVTRISFPTLTTISRLDISIHTRAARPEFPVLTEITRRFTITGENFLTDLPSMPALRSCPLIEIGQSNELTSLRELDDVRAETLRTGGNPKLTSCEIDRTVAAMRRLNPQLQVTRSLESTLPCTP